MGEQRSNVSDGSNLASMKSDMRKVAHPANDVQRAAKCFGRWHDVDGAIRDMRFLIILLSPKAC